MTEFNKVGVYLVGVQEPPLNEVVYVRKEGTIVPCVVLSGQFWKHGRLSNFWYWINLLTKEEESGYGEFYVMKTINTESEGKE